MLALIVENQIKRWRERGWIRGYQLKFHTHSMGSHEFETLG